MKLDALNRDARAAAFEHDKLQLARDIAQIAQLFQCVEKSEKAERLRRITHMRAENSIGASIVENFMLENALHRSGTEHDLMKLADQARLGSKEVLPSTHCACNPMSTLKGKEQEKNMFAG